jgi:hypothetical protein
MPKKKTPTKNAKERALVKTDMVKKGKRLVGSKPRRKTKA